MQGHGQRTPGVIRQRTIESDGSRPSAAAGVHFAPRIGAQGLDLVERPAAGHAPAAPRAPRSVRRRPGAPDRARSISSSVAPPPQRLAQVDAVGRVQAEEPGAVGGEPAAVAVAAERRGRGGDDAEVVPSGQPEPLGRRRLSPAWASGSAGRDRRRHDAPGSRRLRHHLLPAPPRWRRPRPCIR